MDHDRGGSALDVDAPSRCAGSPTLDARICHRDLKADNMCCLATRGKRDVVLPKAARLQIAKLVTTPCPPDNGAGTW
jgi:hypothetical protein